MFMPLQKNLCPLPGIENECSRSEEFSRSYPVLLTVSRLLFQNVSSLVNGAKIMRETSKSLLRGEAERGMLKSKEKNKGEKSVAAVVDACVPVRSAESRQLSTATGNSTFDKEREEVGLFLSCYFRDGSFCTLHNEKSLYSQRNRRKK